MTVSDHSHRAIFILTIIAAFSSGSVNGQIGPADQISCTCSGDLQKEIAKLEADYAGFRSVQRNVQRKAAYERYISELKKQVQNTRQEECIFVLQELTRFFRDGHVFVTENPTLTDEDVARLTNSARRFGMRREEEIRKYLDANSNRLDPIEGIWYDKEGHHFGIIRDQEPSCFVAVLLSEKVDKWEPGEVKAEFRKLADGSYQDTFYSGRHFPLHLNGYLRGESGGAALRRNGLLLHIAPVTWGKLYPLPVGEKDSIDPTDPRKPTVQAYGDSTIVVAVPSHSPEYKKTLDELVEKFRSKIEGAKNLVIDIRGNEGGSTGTTSSLMPFLNSTGKRKGRYWIGDHTVVLSSSDNIAYFQQMESQGWVPKKLIARMQQSPGEMVPYSDENLMGDDNNESDSAELKLPQNVAILMDHAVVSAGEAFIIQAMKNKKVTLFGENSGGVIDYQSVSMIPITKCLFSYYLGYPVFAASARLPAGGVNATGIPPDVRIPLNVRDPYAPIVDYYKRKDGEKKSTGTKKRTP